MASLVDGRSKGAQALRPTDRVVALDGLRAIAAGTVVAYHLGLSAFAGGWIGVDWFFVLSAFLMASGLMDRCDRSGTIDVRQFASRRLRRLVPPLVVMIGATLVAVAAFAPSLLHDALLDAAVSMLYVSNMTDLGASGTERLFIHTWSLSLEMQFYAVVPVAVLWVHRRGFTARQVVRGALVIAAITMTLRIGALFVWRGSTWPTRVPVLDAYRFAIGFALAAALRSRQFTTFERWAARPGVAGICLLLAATEIHTAQYWPQSLAPLQHLLNATLIAVVIAHVFLARSAVRRALEVPLLRTVGMASYSLYLWHVPLFVLLTDGIVIEGRAPLRMAPKVIGVVVLTTVSYLLIERRSAQRPLRTPRPSLAKAGD
jgi:peptidoglycan/LPS O-acetylase OafA/YrhL